MQCAVLHALGKPPRFENFPIRLRAKVKCSINVSQRLR